MVYTCAYEEGRGGSGCLHPSAGRPYQYMQVVCAWAGRTSPVGPSSDEKARQRQLEGALWIQYHLQVSRPGVCRKAYIRIQPNCVSLNPMSSCWIKLCFGRPLNYFPGDVSRESVDVFHISVLNEGFRRDTHQKPKYEGLGVAGEGQE